MQAHLLGFIFKILVFTLSKGREMKATAIPEMAEATKRMFMVSCFSPKQAMSLSFDSLYPTRCEQLTDMALATVGTEPRHSPRTPSSLQMRPNASNTFLQFLRSAGGRLLSDWKRMRAMSVGLATTEPIPPVSKEQAIFSEKVRLRCSLAFTESSMTLNMPSRMPQQMNCLRIAESSPLQSPEVESHLPNTPFFCTTSRPTKKGDRLTVVLPAASRLDWIITLTVSMGWITAEATLPEREPTRKGLAQDQNTLSLIYYMPVEQQCRIKHMPTPMLIHPSFLFQANQQSPPPKKPLPSLCNSESTFNH